MFNLVDIVSSRSSVGGSHMGMSDQKTSTSASHAGSFGLDKTIKIWDVSINAFSIF